ALGELLDRISPIAQDPRVTVDVGDGGRRGPGVHETRVIGDVAGLGQQFPELDAGGAFDRADNLEVVLAIRKAEHGLLALGLRRSRVGHAHASHGHTGRSVATAGSAGHRVYATGTSASSHRPAGVRMLPYASPDKGIYAAVALPTATRCDKVHTLAF